MTQTAYVSGAVFDGVALQAGRALLVEDGRVVDVRSPNDLPDVPCVQLGSGLLAPGLVDLQVNGGGGVLLNQDPTIDGLRRICAAHGGLGTTTLLPTLITDTPEVTARVLDAGIHAAGTVAGFEGLHLEGPHLSVARKGAHDAGLIRKMTDADLMLYAQAAAKLPALMITLAAETVSPEQIHALTRAGVIVFLGHSDANYAQCRAAYAAGARGATHLFNAMSPLNSRAPGMVGAALDCATASAGLIADGHHVDPATLRVALHAKRGPGQLFLVSDAMAVAGTDLSAFHLNGRRITRTAGKLTLADGTLAGADLSLPQAIGTLVTKVDWPVDASLAMATRHPAEVIGAQAGRLDAGCAADFVWLRPDWTLGGVWRAGQSLIPRS